VIGDLGQFVTALAANAASEPTSLTLGGAGKALARASMATSRSAELALPKTPRTKKGTEVPFRRSFKVRDEA
jgi:hypothetical protein